MSGDPEHCHSYSAQDLIKRAKQLKYDVLSITCHKKVIFTKSLSIYAKRHGIILIPGIELEINKKHIIAINIDSEIEKVKTFEDLRLYKKTHPESLIMAPHPFFPGKISLKNHLIENIDIFDTIENSFCYTKSKNYNTPAIKIAKKYNKPILATSDCHSLENLDLAYTHVKAEKNISQIIKAIKNNQIKTHHSPIGYFRITKIILKMMYNEMLKKVFKR
ncbi:MAG: PHP-associated domain-containing protein [Candidatus Gracilibacteria bacterium]|nr:PHP-associated domain-containing protein [Candidatus Gracilibacteria bacterium]